MDEEGEQVPRVAEALQHPKEVAMGEAVVSLRCAAGFGMNSP